MEVANVDMWSCDCALLLLTTSLLGPSLPVDRFIPFYGADDGSTTLFSSLLLCLFTAHYVNYSYLHQLSNI